MFRHTRGRVPFGLLSLVLLGSTWACSSSSAEGPPSASAGAAGSGVTNGGGSNAAGGAPNAGASSAGAANGGSTSASGGASSGASGAGTDGAASGGAGVTWNKVFVTWYGYDDNSCDTEAQHTCANIAYPMSDGYPTKHDGATEGKGTYDDPVTFAAAVKDDPETFGGATINPGTLIYYPKVKKYFMMEDSCAECTDQWTATQLLHVDLWMGPSVPPAGQTMFGQPLIDCEDNGTDSSADNPTDTIIVDPPASLEVDQTMLFTGTQCNVPQ
ncbi:MAG TPA: hypothetical protein VK745_16360 [Polyangiaceae bacterium]|jgi:hypothetical protein|nr:hypothetical protein [Polyangiaceae bacterium]